MEAMRILVSGQVQGVGYRRYAQRQAETFSILGWARNLSDGRVEIFAQGRTENLQSYLVELKKGPNYSMVQEIFAENKSPTPECTDFQILADANVSKDVR